MAEWDNCGFLNEKQTIDILSHCFSHLNLIIFLFIDSSVNDLSCSSQNHSVSLQDGPT